MPTHLQPEIQNTLAGFWCYACEGMTAEVLAHLMDETLDAQTVRDWTELVRYIPHNMLRPSEPPAAYWHARLARHCRSHQTGCSYARTALVQHLLHSDLQAAAAQLDDFAYLYLRLELGSSQARLIWRELLALPAQLRPLEWEDFWRGRQFLIDPPDGPNPQAHLTFLALAEAYAENSKISAQAADWLERVGPEQHWLRQRFRPQTPYSYPMLLALPEADLPRREFNYDGVSRMFFSPEGDRLLSLTSRGKARLWEVHSGRDLGHSKLPAASYEWTPNGLLGLSGNTLYRLDRDLKVEQKQQLPGKHPWGRRFAANGQRLVTANKLNEILVWDWAHGRALATLPAPERGLSGLRLSQDGSRVLMLSADGDLQAWQLDPQGQPWRHHRHTSRPWSNQWSQPDSVWEWCAQGDWVFSWENGTWTCWNRSEGQPLTRWGYPPPDEKILRDERERYLLACTKTVLGRCECVHFDNQRQRALTWKHGCSSAQILDLQDGQVLATLTGHRDALTGGALSGDGRRAATVTRQGNLRIWDTRNGKCLRQLKGRARCVALNEDGTQALSGDSEGQVRLWNISRGHCLSILEGHQQSVEWLAFGAEDRFISGDAEAFLVWGPDRTPLARVPRPPRLYVREVSPCGRYAYAEKLGQDRWGQPLVYDLDEARVCSELPCPTAKPGDACFSADGRQLAVANQEGEFFQSVSLRIWNLGPRAEQTGSYRLALPYNCLALSPTQLAGSCKGNLISLWKLGSPTPPGHEAAVVSLAQQGDRLISGGIDKQARIWGLGNGTCLHQLSNGDRWVNRVHLRGPYASIGDDQQTWLHDLESGRKELQELKPECVSLQGEVLSIEKDRLLWWNPRASGKAPLRLGPHKPEIACCALGPDGQRAVSLTAGGGLKLWDLNSQRCLKSWTTGFEGICSVEWVESQLLMISGPAQRWSWDLEHGAGTRLAAEGPRAHRLEFGNSWQSKPLKVAGLALWSGPVSQALADEDGRISAFLPTGELLFLELMGPGPQGPRARPAPLEKPARRRLRRSGLQQCGLERLQPCQRVLLLGSGGRSDLLAAVPLALSLRTQGKHVFLASPLSGKKTDQRYREIPPKGKAFENRLGGLLEIPLYGFAPEGTLPRLEVLRDLAQDLSIDGLLLVEAGVETLLRGDEPSLGTGADDLVSLAAAQQLELPVKLLANLGFGYDLNKGLSHAYTLEAVAELVQRGGFFGSLSLLPATPEFALLCQCAELLAPSHPVHNLIRALSGEFGGDGYLNPLSNQYWFFDLDQVAARCRVLEWLENKITALDVHRALTNYLTVNPPRPWIEIHC